MDRIIGVGRVREALEQSTGNIASQPQPASIYEQVVGLATSIRDIHPASRTSAEAVNLILAGMDPEARQRTLRALYDVYEISAT